MTEHQRLRAQQNLKEGIPDKVPSSPGLRLSVDVKWVGVFREGDRVLLGVKHDHGVTQADLDRLSSLLEERFPGVEFTIVPDTLTVNVQPAPEPPVPSGNDQ